MERSDRDAQPADTPSSLPSESAVSELMSAWWNLTQAMKRHVAPMLEREHGLEFKDFIVLSAIEDGANYPGLICGRLALTPSTVSRLIDDLVKGELIVRRLDEHDSRRVQLNMTAKGAGVLQATRSTMHALLGQGLNTLRGDQVRLFAQTLQHLSATLSQPDTNQPDTNQPDTNQPDTNQPSASQPDPRQPDTHHPEATQT
jgi:DNA-binding MarR family transcriptional regulator